MTKPAVACIMFGAGGSLFDPANGEVLLVARLRALGIDTAASPYQHYDSQKIYDVLEVAIKARKVVAIIGDSLGANSAPITAGYLPHINYVGMFQPSIWGVHSSIPKNVDYARCFFDSTFTATWGLGYYKMPLAAGNTHTRNPGGGPYEPIDHPAAHPDDWGAAQDVVVADLRRLIGTK